MYVVCMGFGSPVGGGVLQFGMVGVYLCEVMEVRRGYEGDYCRV